MNFFFKRLEEEFMVEILKAFRDVSLNEPCGSFPLVVDCSECGMGATSRAEPVRGVAELRFVIRLKEKAYYFLHQFIRPHRHPQSPLPLHPHEFGDG